MVELFNVSKFAPKTKEELKKQNWYRLDCLTRYKLRTELDTAKLRLWFKQQEHEWQQARKELFYKRLANLNNNNNIRGKYDYLRY